MLKPTDRTPLRLVAGLVFAAGLSLASEAPDPPPNPAARRLPGLAPEHVTVEGYRPERVRLSVAVLDGDGEPVRGLSVEAFDIIEAGASQTILEFAREGDRQDRPLSAVMLVDLSTSVQKELHRWREAAAALLPALRPIDEVRVATFTDSIRVVQDFTNDPALLSRSLDAFRVAGGGTRILRCVQETLRDLSRRRGRKVIFLLTDGLEEGSDKQGVIGQNVFLGELVRRAVRNQVTIVTILTGPSGFPRLAVQDLAEQTGGWWLYPSDDLPGLVRHLGERLLESYHFVYDSERMADDLKRRPVKVLLRGANPAGYQIRTVAGVFGEMPLLEVLEEDLGDDDEARRARAASDLSLLPERRAVDLLGRAARDESAAVRSAAAVSLGGRSEPMAVRWLSRLLRDDDPGVRKAAVSGLSRILLASSDPATRVRILDLMERAEP